MKFFIFLTLILSYNTYAQFNVHTGINFPTNALESTNSNYLFRLWQPGINLGINYDYSLSDDFAISPYLEYSYYIFDSYDDQPGIPELRLVSSNGDNSKIFRMGVFIKYSPSMSPLPQGYFITGFGYTIEKIGKIKFNYYDINRGEFSTVQEFGDKNYFVHMLGIGSRVIELNSFQIFIEVRSYSNYKDILHVSLNVGLMYKL